MGITKLELDDLTYEVIGAVIEVHKHLGPGLLESVYQKCLAKELSLRRLKYEMEFPVEVRYKGEKVNIDLRCDFVIEDALVVELKSVKELIPIFDAQLLTYMNLLQKPKGLLVNFNVRNIFSSGQKTFVNKLFSALPDH